MVMKHIENTHNIGFVFNQIYPVMTTIIIDKTNVVFKISIKGKVGPQTWLCTSSRDI
jgi:hypothetical protein